MRTLLWDSGSCFLDLEFTGVWSCLGGSQEFGVLGSIFNDFRFDSSGLGV